MNKRLLPLLYSLFLLVAFSSCSKKPFFNFKITHKEKIEVESLDFKYLSLKSKIQFHNGEKQMGSSANIRIQKGEKVWVSVTPFIGIEAVRILFTPDSLVYLNKLDKNYQVFDYSTLSKKYNTEINYETIEAFLVGNMPYERSNKDKIDREETKFEIIQKRDDLRIINEIDPVFLKLKKLHIQKQNSKNFLSLNYSNFKSIDKGGKKKQENYFPFQLLLDLVYYQNNELISGQVSFTHHRVNMEDNLRFPFKISKKYVQKK